MLGKLLLIFVLLLQVPSTTLAGTSKIRAVNLGGWLVVEKWIKPSLFDAIPHNDLLDGTQIQLKSVALGTYISAEGGGGQVLSVNRSTASGWETFKLWRVSSTQFQLRVFNNKFVSAENGAVSATKATPGTQETFSIERQDPKSSNLVHIRASSGQYLQARSRNQLTADYYGFPDWAGNAVFELHIQSSLGGEFQLANGYGPNQAASVFQQHRSTFVVEEDFRFLAQNQINAVRIPVGWWTAYDPNPPAPFVSGSLQALDDAFDWAERLGIGIIIDLHAAPGSQNPSEHSGTRDGVPTWTQAGHISQTLEVIEIFASRYSTRKGLLGIELLNEPTSADVPLDVLKDYYRQGYQAIRKHSSSCYVIMCARIGDADPSELVNHLPPDSHSNVVLDIHPYNLFDSVFDGKSVEWNIDFINNNRTQLVRRLNEAGGASIFVGEWTNEWKVSGASQSDYARFGAAQLAVYGQASFGWSYWTLNNVNLHWDFQKSVRNGFLVHQSNGGWP